MTEPTLAQSLLVAARTAKVLLTTAESCTGGLIAGAITDVPGSSDIFDRGFVTYTNAAKTQMLGVKAVTLDAYGAVSTQVAAEMALGALAASDAQIALSVTGIAGPGGSEHKPEGMVVFGLASNGHAQTFTQQFGPLGRANVRAQSVAYGLNLLLQAIAQDPPRN